MTARGRTNRSVAPTKRGLSLYEAPAMLRTLAKTTMTGTPMLPLRGGVASQRVLRGSTKLNASLRDETGLRPYLQGSRTSGTSRQRCPHNSTQADHSPPHQDNQSTKYNTNKITYYNYEKTTTNYESVPRHSHAVRRDKCVGTNDYHFNGVWNQ